MVYSRNLTKNKAFRLTQTPCARVYILLVCIMCIRVYVAFARRRKLMKFPCRWTHLISHSGNYYRCVRTHFNFIQNVRVYIIHTYINSVRHFFRHYRKLAVYVAPLSLLQLCYYYIYALPLCAPTHRTHDPRTSIIPDENFWSLFNKIKSKTLWVERVLHICTVRLSRSHVSLAF